jgi:hypothetical protein
LSNDQVSRIGMRLENLVCASEYRKESSSPGESHPQALTEPDVTVSRHPALIIPSQLSETCLTVWLLPSLVDQRVKLDDPTPSLHLHYRDFPATPSWCWDRNTARAVLSGELPTHAPFRYMQRVPNSTLTHVSASPPFSSRTVGFPESGWRP